MRIAFYTKFDKIRRNVKMCEHSICFLLLNKICGTLKMRFCIDIIWRCLKTLIAVVVYLIVTSY